MTTYKVLYYQSIMGDKIKIWYLYMVEVWDNQLYKINTYELLWMMPVKVTSKMNSINDNKLLREQRQEMCI